jgi:hypothetical protein
MLIAIIPLVTMAGKVSHGCGGVRKPWIPERFPHEGEEEVTMRHDTS